jgi:effector-binding domain-containing protein
MWAELNSHIEKNGGKRTIPCMMMYHKGWEHSFLDVEVIEPLIKPLMESETVKVYELPPVEKILCAIHKGAFSEIHATINNMYKQINENKFTACGSMREIYHKGEWAADNPNDYVTEIQIPIK